MNAVEQTILSRRPLFQADAAASAAAVLGAAGTAPAMANGHGKIADMTHIPDEAFPTVGGVPGITYDQQVNVADHGECPSFLLSVNKHRGTHVDAPLHFLADSASVAGTRRLQDGFLS